MWALGLKLLNFRTVKPPTCLVMKRKVIRHVKMDELRASVSLGVVIWLVLCKGS
jgi:hypothetical protein